MSSHGPRLRSYQDDAVDFLRDRRWAILADEPGVGKTAPAIVAADTPTVVICPASVMIHWRREIQRWRPDDAARFHVVSYADRRLHLLRPGTYATVIVDEAHYVKTMTSKRSKLVCRLLRQARGRGYALSGTLVPNRPIELWPLMFAMRMTELEYGPFAFRFAAAYEDERNQLDVRGASNLPELRDLLAPHCLRRTKADVLPELPPKTWRVIALDLPIDEQEKEFSLRDLVRMEEPIAFEAMSDIRHLHGVRKVPLVLEHMRNLLASVNKVLLFAHHRDVIGSLVAGLKEFEPLTLTGDTTPRQRQGRVDLFARSSRNRVFIGQDQAIGTGTDGLQRATSHVVISEGSWVPGELEQWSDRVHRIGTRDNVTIDLLTIEGSIDEHMLRRALEKQGVIDRIMPQSPQKTVDSGTGPALAYSTSEGPTTEKSDPGPRIPRHLHSQDGTHPRSSTKEKSHVSQKINKAFEKLRSGLDDLEEATLEELARIESDAGDDPPADPPAETTSKGTKKKAAKKGPKKKAAAAKLTHDDVRAALLPIVEKYSPEDVDEVLKEFSVTQVSDLEPDQFPAVIKAAEAYLED